MSISSQPLTHHHQNQFVNSCKSLKSKLKKSSKLHCILNSIQRDHHDYEENDDEENGQTDKPCEYLSPESCSTSFSSSESSVGSSSPFVVSHDSDTFSSHKPATAMSEAAVATHLTPSTSLHSQNMFIHSSSTKNDEFMSVVSPRRSDSFQLMSNSTGLIIDPSVIINTEHTQHLHHHQHQQQQQKNSQYAALSNFYQYSNIHEMDNGIANNSYFNYNINNNNTNNNDHPSIYNYHDETSSTAAATAIVGTEGSNSVDQSSFYASFSPIISSLHNLNQHSNQATLNYNGYCYGSNGGIYQGTTMTVPPPPPPPPLLQSNEFYANQSHLNESLSSYGHHHSYYFLNKEAAAANSGASESGAANSAAYFACSQHQQANENSLYFQQQPHHQQQPVHSHQISYSNETNSLMFNIESNHSTADFESSNLTDTDEDDDDDDENDYLDDDDESESNDDMSLNYRMEVSNYMILNQQQQQQHKLLDLNESNSKKKPGKARKTYQKKGTKSKNTEFQQQQHSTMMMMSSYQSSNSNGSMTSNNCNSSKRKRKRILNRLQRAEATMREKRRMLKLNKAFEELRKVLPISEFAKNKLSRAETLKSAIEYIEKMSEILSI